MKTLLGVVLVLTAASHSFALMGIGRVTEERAKELGMEIRTEAAGPDAVGVQLEFKTEGELKDFVCVELRISEAEKSVITATLQEKRPSPGRVRFYFTANRAQLNKIALWVVVGRMDMTAYELRVQDFVELEKPHLHEPH